MYLNNGALLKNGEYRIEKVLAAGGFGITYLAMQVALGRKVAVKEFFMKEHCNRDSGNSYVSVPSVGSKEQVEHFKEKFLKEARLIASFDHSNIIRIHDVFEENGTAYYVMEYLEGESLSALVARCGAIDEQVALRYTRQVADALAEVHAGNLLHLDVKPANIMLNKKGEAVLIDFGISKHYDETGSQTSSAAVGISEGYAPLEQYEAGALGSFTPATDVYSLGATLYFLVTGQRPPKAGDVMNDGLPVLPSDISPEVRAAIEAAMQPRRKDRPQSVVEFLNLLESTDNREQSTDNREQGEDLIDDSDVEVTVLPESGKIKDERLKIKEQSENFDRSQKAKAIDEQSEATRKTDNEETRALEKEPEQVAVTDNGPAEPKKNRTAWVVAVLGVLIGCGLFFAYGNDDISTSQKVDLGLSVCWAGWNVGASSPEEYGDYYAWGETTTKSNYTESSYQYHNGRDYVNIGRNISGTQYDVARAQWGGSWRMPTKAECQELKDRCSWTWTSYKGIDGYKVTGPNGNSIFLPAADHCYGTEPSDRGSFGYCRSGSLHESYQSNAYSLNFNSGGGRRVGYFCREIGHTVRPVCDK